MSFLPVGIRFARVALKSLFCVGRLLLDTAGRLLWDGCCGTVAVRQLLWNSRCGTVAVRQSL